MKLVKEKSTGKYKKITDSELTANPDLYIDRSYSPIYWYDHHLDAGFTYWQARYNVQQLVHSKANGINDFKDPEKDAIGKFALGNQNDLISFYIPYFNLSLSDAQGLHVQRFSINTSKMALDAKEIIRSPKMMQIGIKYLTWVDSNGNVDATQANNLTSAIQGFLTEFERYALLGLNYGDEREGLMDYFESTNSYASGGLKNYTFNPDMVAYYGTADATRLAMIAELQDLFVKGNI